MTGMDCFRLKIPDSIRAVAVFLRARVPFCTTKMLSARAKMTSKRSVLLKSLSQKARSISDNLSMRPVASLSLRLMLTTQSSGAPHKTLQPGPKISQVSIDEHALYSTNGFNASSNSDFATSRLGREHQPPAFNRWSQCFQCSQVCKTLPHARPLLGQQNVSRLWSHFG